MTIIIYAWHLYVLAAVILCLAAGVEVYRRRRRLTRIKFPPGYEHRLKVWVAEQLSDLGPEKTEAMQLWAWAERQGWRTVAENVHLGSEYPLAKKATEQ